MKIALRIPVSLILVASILTPIQPSPPSQSIVDGSPSGKPNKWTDLFEDIDSQSNLFSGHEEPLLLNRESDYWVTDPLHRKARASISAHWQKKVARKKRDAPRRQASAPLPKPLSMPGLIIAHGYPAEVHHVTTEDGYILEMHRIPGPRLVDTSPKKKKLGGAERQQRRRRRLSEVEKEKEDDCIPLSLLGEKTNHLVDLNSTRSISIVNNNVDRLDLARNLRRLKRQRPKRQASVIRERINRRRHIIRTVDPRILIETTRRRRRLNRRRKLSPIDTRLRWNSEASKRSINGGEGTLVNLVTESKETPKPVACSSEKCVGRNTEQKPLHESGVQQEKPRKFCSEKEIQKDSTKPGTNKPFKAKGKKKVVFIQHCLQCSSADFVLNDHNQALGFVLADAGYDVWLGNFRGNQYSRKHKFLSPNKIKYWKFKVDDLAQYDLPAMIDYVLDITQSSTLNYIGHSLGTMTFFMAASSSPVFRSKINMMVALAPAGYLDHMKGGLRFMLKSSQNFYGLMEALGVGEVGGVETWRGGLVRRACKPSSPFVAVCSSFLPAVSGRNTGLHDEEYLPMLLSNFPAGTSLRLMAQIGQIIGADGIRKFDFGNAASNILRYGTASPPHYKLENIDIPVAIMWTENDYIVTPEDVARTAKRLPNVILNYRVPHDTFNHVDFLFADIARQLVYEPIIELLDMY